MRLAVAALVVASVVAMARDGAVTSARIGSDGRGYVSWAGKPERQVPRDRGGYCDGERPGCEDTSEAEIQISPDHRTVGWFAQYRCCGSYDSPMALMIARDGRVLHRFAGARGVLCAWEFQDGGRYVVLYADFPHGPSSPFVARYEVMSGKKVAEYSGPFSGLPVWAKGLVKSRD